jgi:putative DNA primase/helicase
LAIAQEMPENRKMNESLVKSITGGDRIATRELYKDIFQFTPTHKLWISGNHKPRISGTDDGIWRRLRIVPFTVTIPEAKRRNLSDIMDEFKRHLPGILQWAVLGAMMWYQQGLRSCGAVDRATSEYRGEEDAVARFVGDRCELHPSANIDKVKLYLAWKDWAEDEGDRSAQMKSQRWLMTQLGKRFGCEAGGNGRRLIVGIRLSDADAINDHIAPGVRIMQ